MIMYKLSPINIFTKTQTSVIRLSDGAIIPLSDDNTDYQQYLKWVEEGNTPLPADEGAA